MKASKLYFVSFEPHDGAFRAFMLMEDAFSDDEDPEAVLDRAAKIYGRSVQRMRRNVVEMQRLRGSGKRVPARKMWQLGDAVFQLVDELKRCSLEVDGLYQHLSRDLEVKRKWLEKAIVFRRYLPDQKVIPESLNWGRCEKGTRRIAEGLRRGLSPDKIP